MHSIVLACLDVFDWLNCIWLLVTFVIVVWSEVSKRDNEFERRIVGY